MSIETKNLTLSFGEARVLHEISVSIEDGEFVGVMGRTGCGKTSFMQILAGLIRPTSGEVWIDGEDIFAPRYDRKKLRRALGFVFQFPEVQLFETTVERDVTFALKHSGLSRAKMRERAIEALAAVGFSDESILEQSPLSLSGGQRRRVAVAGVLAAKPKILILDEPLAGLDPTARREFLSLLRRLNREESTTILMISHNADALAENCSRILVLDEGKILSDGAPQDVFFDADALRARHLDVSFARQTAQLLQKGGFDMPQDVVSFDALLENVLCALGREGGAHE